MRHSLTVRAGTIALFMIGSAPLAAQETDLLPISSAQLEAKAREACRGDAAIAPDAIRLADMDGDGRTDVLFNWAGVTCSAGSAMQRKGAGFCGMHNCSIDVYLSSQYKPGGWPKPILNHMEIAPQIVSAKPYARLRTSYQGGSCTFAKVCRREWVWNGSKFESRELTAADETNQPPIATALEVTRANVAGVWVDSGDGCATDAVLSFQADGSYASYEQNGDWRLLGNRIAVVVRETYVMGDAGSTRRVQNPSAVMLEVVALSAQQMTLKMRSGGTTTYRRCG